MANEAFRNRYESLVERRIREAQEQGAFDGLPGAGRPLPRGRDDENWWLRSYLEREGLPTDVLLPTPLRLRREVARLPETVREIETEREVREAVADLARRVAEWMRFPDGPQVAVPMPRPAEIVARWREDRARDARLSERDPAAAPDPAGRPPAAPVRPGRLRRLLRSRRR